MAAPSTKIIRNFKGNFRAAVVDILNTAGWSDATFERAATNLSATARREISFDLGDAINETCLDSGTHVYDFFNATLRISIVTGRSLQQSFPAAEARDLHESLVADALDLFAEEKAPFTEALLPYYAVKTLRPIGTKSDFDVIYFEDRTDIDFALQFGIRITAWPVGT